MLSKKLKISSIFIISHCHTGIDLTSGSDAPLSLPITVPISVLKILAEERLYSSIDTVPIMYFKFCKRLLRE